MKEQNKSPEKQLNEMEIGNFLEKIQNNESENDPGAWENNGEDAINVYQRLRRTKGQTSRDE